MSNTTIYICFATNDTFANLFWVISKFLKIEKKNIKEKTNKNEEKQNKNKKNERSIVIDYIMADKLRMMLLVFVKVF